MISFSRYHWSLVCAVVLFFTACSPARKAIKEPLKEQGAAFLFEKLKSTKPVFHALSTRASIDIKTDENSISLKAQVRIKKDSAIWMSFSPLLGIEAVRLLLTPDSVKFIDRLNKNYFIGTYGFFSEFYQVNFDYDMIESILLGADFNSYDEGEMKAGIDHLQYTLATANRRKIRRFVRSHADAQRVLLQNLWLDPESFKIIRLKLKEANRDSRRLDVEYDSYTSMENGDLIPQNIMINISAEKNIRLKLKQTKLEVNTSLSFPFNIPSSYNAIHFNEQ